MNAIPLLDAIADQVGTNAVLRWLVSRDDCPTWSYSRLDRPHLLILDDEAINVRKFIDDPEATQ